MVVDDQVEAKELVSEYISRVPTLSLKYSSTNPIEALNFLDSQSVDAIFLDIEMPEISGLEFIQTVQAKFGNSSPKVILITGYDQYAVSGYDHGVFDYLLKPISFKRFKICIDRLTDSFKASNENRNYFFLDVDGQKVKINFDEIIYIEGAGNYVIVATKEKKIICYRSLTSFDNVLPDQLFMRIHKSFIVSFDKIQAVRGNEIILNSQNAKHLPIGVTYKEKFLKALKISE